jgi:hypothetical protein
LNKGYIVVALENLLEVRLKKSDDFLKIKETLTRIGITNSRKRTLYQTAHILHKRGRYYIVHFKEMFALDGKKSTLTAEDSGRRSAIAILLQEWGLLTLVKPLDKNLYMDYIHSLHIIPHSEKDRWRLVEKYKVGKKFNIGM